MPLSTLLPFYSTKTLKFKFPGAAVGHTVLPRGKVTYDAMEIKILKSLIFAEMKISQCVNMWKCQFTVMPMC